MRKSSKATPQIGFIFPNTAIEKWKEYLSYRPYTDFYQSQQNLGDEFSGEKLKERSLKSLTPYLYCTQVLSSTPPVAPTLRMARFPEAWRPSTSAPTTESPSPRSGPLTTS